MAITAQRGWTTVIYKAILFASYPYCNDFYISVLFKYSPFCFILSRLSIVQVIDLAVYLYYRSLKVIAFGFFFLWLGKKTFHPVSLYAGRIVFILAMARTDIFI